jgi:hypothetical protein
MAKQARPKDVNQLAKSILDIATGETEDTINKTEINAAAVTLGRLGGLKGGNARAAKLTSKERSDIAKKAAAARWNKK